MAESVATELEVAIAETGLLLIELEKFRVAPTSPAASLRAESLGVGDRARRLHRAGTLDDAAAAALVRETRGIVERLRRTLQDVRDAPAYREAVAAHRGGDHAALARLLPELLVGLEHVTAPPALFHPVGWLRRNRPRPPADVAAEVARLRDTGFVASGDATAWGSDPELPAVPLLAVQPSGDPIALRFEPEDLPPAVFRLRETDEHLVHVPVLRSPFTAALPDTLDPDELGEISLDHPRYRAELLDALGRCGVRVHGA
jgi:hypothetical protein